MGKPISRREFVQTAAFAAAGIIALPSFIKIANTQKSVGLQLYTLRDVLPANVKGILREVAGLGVAHIETYGYDDGKLFGMKAADFGKYVKTLGLKVSSGHYGTGQINKTQRGTLTNDWERAVADARVLGQEYMVIAWLDEKERTSLDDYKRVCALMNERALLTKKYGIRLAYHNHAFEFEPLEGQIPYDIMLNELDPSLVSMELDLYWVMRAGKDPLSYFEKYPGRFEQWHVKDMDATDPSKNADVGTGSIDFKTIFEKAQLSGLKYYYLEQENYQQSPMASVKEGIRNLKNIVK